MSVNLHVDYKRMPKQAQQMREQGIELNNELIKVYDNVDKMRKNWYGERYNELLKFFNALIPQINDMTKLVVDGFPSTLESISNNYSGADKGNTVTSVNTGMAKQIQKITDSPITTFGFNTIIVRDVQNQVKTGFTKSIDKMNQIESIYKGIDWNSDSANNFRNKFTKLKTEIIQAFNEINKQFKELMDKAVEDVEKSEKSSDVG